LLGAVSLIAIVLGIVLATQLSSSSSSSSSNINTVIPTMSPTRYAERDNVFRTTDELYEAVDAYLIGLNETTGAGVATSAVAQRYGPIRTWNVSLITNFSRVFDPIRDDVLSWDTVASEYYLRQFTGDTTPTEYDPRRFNEDLSGWDVSNAETMMGMFSRSDYFVGRGLEDWNVGKVKDFSFMFMGASVFNGSISEWDTSSAETMESMLLGTFAYNDDLALWDVSNVVAMNHMFYFAEVFIGDGLSSWNVSKVATTESMFAGAIMFNGDLSTWDTGSVTTMTQMVSTERR
jgi:surface protein